jgi:hypothetical protein
MHCVSSNKSNDICITTFRKCVCMFQTGLHSLSYSVCNSSTVCLRVQNGSCVQWKLRHILCNKTVSCEKAGVQYLKVQSVYVH